MRRHCWAVVSALALLASPVRVALGQTFTGGGTTPNWSEAANWDTNQVPTSGTITIDLAAGEPTTVVQDVASPYVLNSLTFTPRGRNVTLEGNPIRLEGVGATIVNEAQDTNSRVIRQRVELASGLEYWGTGPGAVAGGLTLKDVGGASSVVVRRGTLRIGRADYTGQTVVRDGKLEIGGWTYAAPFLEFLQGSTSGQGDYIISTGPAGAVGSPRLTGYGTIGSPRARG